jgi:predicted CoA-substrate-specific enzyme activase
MILGVDAGSTTCKYTLVDDDGNIVAREYGRHNSKQAEKVLEFLGKLEAEHGLTPGRDRVYFTGSGSGFIAPQVGGKIIQEVVAVAAAVEKLHPSVQFVSEIGGEDMKTIFFTGNTESKNKQVLMQSACSGGTGTFVEKTARKLGVVDQLATMGYNNYTLHKISSKCGIFAEADSNTLVKSGVAIEEIIASLFEAVVYQNLSTLTKGNTPMPEVLLLGGPNMFFKGLQEAWKYHLGKLWTERKVKLPEGKSIDELILIPDEALYYAALGCIEVAKSEAIDVGVYTGREKLQWWLDEGQHAEKKKSGSTGLWATLDELTSFKDEYGSTQLACNTTSVTAGASAILGCDFGSTTAKAVCLSPEGEVLFSCYALSKGNPIEDAKKLFEQVEAAGYTNILGVGITGYGKDLLRNIIGVDAPVVETVAHATAALHYFEDADCICDVGGVDVKIMLIKQGAVTDFRLNSQCSSGNGAFLQGVAERYAVPLDQYAERAFQAESRPQLSMGCGVFLQSDIVNQQRKGWSAEEIMAGLAGIMPLNCWVYAGGFNNLGAVGKKFILQGGTHRNLAVVKAQVDFIRSKVPDAEVVVHPYSGEAGAIGAGLCAIDEYKRGKVSSFRGFRVIEKLTYKTTTSTDTICTWCPVSCKRTFIDVELEGSTGREWSKVPVAAGWERVITNNSCPKGLVEDKNEMKIIKTEMDKTKAAYPNIGELVRKEAFKEIEYA